MLPIFLLDLRCITMTAKKDFSKFIKVPASDKPSQSTDALRGVSRVSRPVSHLEFCKFKFLTDVFFSFLSLIICIAPGDVFFSRV